VLVVRDGYSASLMEADLGPDGRGQPAPSDVAGRRPLGQLAADDETLLVRTHQHGGLLRFLTGARFLDSERPFRELLLSVQLEQLGLPTPRVVGARAQRIFGPFWSLMLVSVRVPGAEDLGRALAKLSSEREARPLMRAMGSLVGRLHRAGLEHVDLHPGNMLVESSWANTPNPKLWILDLDRCRLVESLPDDVRLSMLARLMRYAIRRPELARVSLTSSNLMRFMHAYQETLGGAGDKKADWRGVGSRLQAAAKRHRLGWRLEEVVGAGAETRQT